MKEWIKKFQLPLLAATIVIVVVAGAIFGVSAAGSKENKIKKNLNLGDKYLSEARYEEAIVEYEKVIAIDPRQVPAYVGMAEAYEGLGNTEKAVEIYEQGIAAVEEAKLTEGIVLEGSERLYIGEALILESQGLLERSLSILERGFEITNSDDFWDLIDRLKEKIQQLKEEEDARKQQEEEERRAEEERLAEEAKLSEGEEQELTEEESSYLTELNAAMQGGETSFQEVYRLLTEDFFATLLEGMPGGADYFYDGEKVVGLSGDLNGSGLVIRQGIDRIQGGAAGDGGLGWEVYYGSLQDGKPSGTGFAAGVDYSDGSGTLLFHIGSWSGGLPNGEGQTGFLRLGGNQGQLDQREIKRSSFVNGLCEGTVYVTSVSYDGQTEEFELTASGGQIVRDETWLEDTEGYFDGVDYYLPGKHGSLALFYDDTNNDVCTRTAFLAKR